MYGFKIDVETCTKCGLCAGDCPLGCIEMGDFPKMEQENCIKCQHCLAICPHGALSFGGYDPADSLELKGNMPTADQMETLIKGRRSVRKYKDENLQPDVMQRLLDTAWHAPTGLNVQSVLMTVVDDKDTLAAFKEETYALLTETLSNMDVEGNHVLEFLAWAVGDHNENGTDVVFRGAPHFIVTSAPEAAPSPKADTLIQLSYFELMAQSMGIGTVWNGMLLCSLQMCPQLLRKLGVPGDHTLGYAMSFGSPAVKYKRTVQRGSAPVNCVS